MDRSRILSNVWLAAGLVALNIVLFNLIMEPVNALRLDTTQGKIYSLSPVTKRIVRNLDEKVHIRAYISSMDLVYEQLRPLVPEILNLLDEYAVSSDGKVIFERIVPEDDPAAEKTAQAKYGITATPYVFQDQRQKGVRSFYFSIVVEYAGTSPTTVSIDDLVEPDIFDPAEGQKLKLKNVEYAVTRAIKKSVEEFESRRDVFQRFPHKAVVRTYITPKEQLPEILKEVPEIADKVLSDLAKASDGKLEYVAVPVPEDPAEQRRKASELNVSPIPFTRDRDIYLWATLEIDGELYAVMPLMDLESGVGEFALRQAFEQVFRRLTPGMQRVIGLAQDMPKQDPMAAAMGRPTPPPRFGEIGRRLGEDYEVRNIDLKTLDKVPADIDLLLVMGPRALTPEAVFAIDQYVMGGGRAIFAVDRTDVQLMSWGRLTGTAAKTGLEDLLGRWGVVLSEEGVFDEACGVFPWPDGDSPPGRRPALTDHRWASLPIVGDVPGGVQREHQLTSNFEVVRFWYPSAIETTDVDGVDATWLLRSSPQAWTGPATGFEPDFARYPLGFPRPDGEERGRKVFAVALHGTFKSWFADHDVPRKLDKDTAASDGDSDSEEKTDGDAKESSNGTEEGTKTQDEKKIVSAPLTKSRPTRLLVIANDDFVDDFQAVTAQWGMPLSFYAMNTRFFAAAVDWMLQDEDLQAIRNRGRSYRPLKPIEEATKKSIIFWNFTGPLILLVLLGLGLMAARANRRPMM